MRHIFLLSISLSLILLSSVFVNISITSAFAQVTLEKIKYLGVDVSGFYTRTAQARDSTYDLPPNYFDESFKILSSSGMNHVRFLIFWEAFVKNPVEFMNELKTVATAADKWGINVIYDNHQFHTSSYLNPQRGTGFPFFLFESNSSYFYSGGGGTKYPAAKIWWEDWWNRSVKDSNGNDGWTLLAEFMKKIVATVDNHTSTLGYELLSEPQVHDVGDWEKIGLFNTLMVNTLRQYTDKTLVYSMNIPIDLKGPIQLNAENLAKMAPKNKENVVFKISSYGLPEKNTYQGDRIDVFVETSKLTNIPLYVGEWNNVKREKTINEDGEIITVINEELSNINQTEANMIVDRFADLNIWGMAFWQWRVDEHRVSNYNLINVTSTGQITTTPYFDIVKTAYDSLKS